MCWCCRNVHVEGDAEAAGQSVVRKEAQSCAMEAILRADRSSSANVEFALADYMHAWMARVSKSES